eukprot:11635147-Heterocapsa_arctica.AAC.1
MAAPAASSLPAVLARVARAQGSVCSASKAMVAMCCRKPAWPEAALAALKRPAVARALSRLVPSFSLWVDCARRSALSRSRSSA